MKRLAGLVLATALLAGPAQAAVTEEVRDCLRDYDAMAQLASNSGNARDADARVAKARRLLSTAVKTGVLPRSFDYIKEIAPLASAKVQDMLHRRDDVLAVLARINACDVRFPEGVSAVQAASIPASQRAANLAASATPAPKPAPAASAAAPPSGYQPWPAELLYPGKLFTTATMKPEVEQALKGAGFGDRVQEAAARISQKGWPGKMSATDVFYADADFVAEVKKYNVTVVARFTYAGQQALLLHVPAARNQHMINTYRPSADFFIVALPDAVKRRW